MTPILGVDLSEHNWRHGIPFGALPRLHAAGVRFVLARASIGTAIDPSFAHNRHRATFRSWIPGSYHYLTDSVAGDRQAETYIGQLLATGGVDGLLKGLDVEDDRVGIRNRVSRRHIEDFLGRFHEAYPRQQIKLYTNRSTWHRLGNPDVGDLGFDGAWQALYGIAYRPEDLPARPPIGFGGEGHIPLWQWGTLKVAAPRQGEPGHRIEIDGDAWYGTLAELRADSVAERPPLGDRKPYRTAFNAELDLIDRLIIGADPEIDGTPAEKAGIRDAIEAAREAVAALKIGD